MDFLKKKNTDSTTQATNFKISFNTTEYSFEKYTNKDLEINVLPIFTANNEISGKLTIEEAS